MCFRIEPTDKLEDIIVKLSEGNPGAASVLCYVVQSDAMYIDPDNIFMQMGPLLSLDMYDITGSRIYVLFKYACSADMRTFLLLLRAVGLGVMAAGELRALATDHYEKKPIAGSRLAEIDEEVCALLPNFQKK